MTTLAHMHREERDDRWLLAHDEPDALRFRLARQAAQAWGRLSVQERCRRLSPLRKILRDDMHGIAQRIAEENGKPHVEALAHEVGAVLSNLRYLLANAPRVLRPRNIQVPWLPHRRATLSRLPHGVVLVISPWNFPLSIPLGQVLAALVTGNAVILKPSEVTPECGQLIETLLGRLDLPPNLFALVEGDGSVGAKLIELRPDKVFFTGSVATGRKVMTAAAKHPIPVCLELGGVDAMIVLEDADLELATSAAAWGLAFNGGQVCASVERLLVHASIQDAFAARLRDKLQRLQPAQDLGRITHAPQKRVYQSHLEDAKTHGCEVFGATYVDDRTLAPGLVSGARVESAKIFRDETFGPLATLSAFRNDAEAIKKHNTIPCGLTASVFSNDRARAERMAGALQAGLVSINDVAATLHAFGEIPWGGVGQSGFGRSHGEDGLLEFTRNHVIERTRRGLFEFKRPWWFPYDAWQQHLMTEFTSLLGARGVAQHVKAGARAGKAALDLLRYSPRP